MKFKHAEPRLFNAMGPLPYKSLKRIPLPYGRGSVSAYICRGVPKAHPELADACGSVSVLSRDRKGVVSAIKGLALGILCSGMLWAASDPVDLVTSADLRQMTKKLAAESKRDGGGFAGETLKRYGNHLTMIAHREKSGSAELHTKDADIFMVVDGTATIVTGGKMVKAHTTASGESRGTGIEGGVTRKLAPGDIIHIAPNTPHQLKLEPGHTFTYFVVKVHS